MASWPRTEQEEKLEAMFGDLAKLFKKIKKSNNPDKIHGMLKDVSKALKEGKALIKEFEFEARTDGMPAPLLAERRKDLVTQINTFIAMKKEIGDSQAARSQLMHAAAPVEEDNLEGMSMAQLIKKGHKEINEINAGLDRAERLVNDTIDIGTQAASGLNDQTKKLEQIVDDLNEIEFTMKKASKVIRDITRGLLTDKCIGFLLFLVAGGVIALIVVKVVKPNAKAITSAACNTTFVNCTTLTNATTNLLNTITTTTTNAVTNAVTSAANNANSITGAAPGTGRRMLVDKILRAAVAIMQDQEDA